MKALLVAAVLLALSGCATEVQFPTSGRVDYQLGGASQPPSDVMIVARDREDPPLPGVYSICYINGFQTQPHELDFWLDEHPELLLRDEAGDLQTDPNWPDEVALDTSSADSREQLADIIGEWIDKCAADGFHAVEFDNLDSYSRFSGLTLDANAALAAVLVEHAHGAGLEAGQKNTVELGERGPEIGFDFAIAEECFVYRECGDYTTVYGSRVIDIEYDDTDLDGLCEYRDLPTFTIVRDRDLTPGGTFWSCND